MSLSFSGFIDVLGLCRESENNQDAQGLFPGVGGNPRWAAWTAASQHRDTFLEHYLYLTVLS